MAASKNHQTSFGSSATSKTLTAEEIAEHEIALDELSRLERDFAAVDLAQRMGPHHYRTKEHALRPLYSQRQSIVSRIPEFWSTIFLTPPPQISQYIQPSDVELLTHITSFQVERFEINESGTGGDPRSLRITFEFAANGVMEDKKLVKELRYRHGRTGNREGFLSDPVPIKWKNKKKDLTRGLGPCAISLFEAEKAVKLRVNGQEVDAVERQGLWQNERVLQGLRTMAELGQQRLGFFGWFYYRGMDLSPRRGGGDEDLVQTDSEDDVEGDDGLRDVEVFPDGSDLANFLAEHLWEDAVDLYVESMKEPDSELDDDSRDILDRKLSQIQNGDADPKTNVDAESSVESQRYDDQGEDVDGEPISEVFPPKPKRQRRS